MSLSKCGVFICPCCAEKTLQSNGAFFICATCGLAITTQALTKAAQYNHEAATFEDTIVTASN